jgi:hypothetical protein
MNRGYFNVSKELIESEQWPSIEAEIQKNFREVHRKEVENGIIQLHGYSELFNIKPTEGASQRYEAYFKGKKLTHFNPID